MLKEIRDQLGGPSISDEELLLRYVMKGDQEIKAMRAAGSPKQYFDTAPPLLSLMEELKKHRGVRYLSLRRGDDNLLLQNQSAA